jgi:hypothetical protein
MIHNIELVPIVVGLAVVGMIVGGSTANFIFFVRDRWWRK